MRHYVLNGKEPVEVADAAEVTGWCQRNPGAWRVALTGVGDCEVSTVFLHYSMYNPDPAGRLIFFETMAFTELGTYQARYATWDEAEAGHQRMVIWIQFWNKCQKYRRRLDDLAEPLELD